MENEKLCTSDYRFMDIVWDNEPVKSGELVSLCNEKLGWKKSTTYTMVKKLSQKGYLKNENSIVTSLIPRKEVQMFESNYVVNSAFGGSLPSFIASFVSRRQLSKKEIEEIRSIIDNMEE
ncbi:MAG: BlaI/MecI/CopY family transcriptional regulator [Clostridia bacterium]|nr:BlaI/MecI/CopY family transcriptional regulator [Clostridia bacterium]